MQSYKYSSGIGRCPSIVNLQDEDQFQGMGKIPTFSEIQISLQKLKKIVPQAITDQLINFVFVTASQLKTTRLQQYQSQNAQKIQNLRATTIVKIKETLSEQTSLIDQLQGQQFEETSSSRHKLTTLNQTPQRRSQIQRLIAQFYCNGISNFYDFQEQLHQSNNITLTKMQYNQILTNILSEVYDQLQNIVYEHNKIVPVNKQQMKRIMDIMIKCKTNLTPALCSAIYKVVNKMKGICTVSVDKEECLNLYEQIHVVRNQKRNKHSENYAQRLEMARRDRIKNEFNARLKEIQYQSYSYQEGNQYSNRVLPSFKEKARKSRITYELHNVWSAQYEKQLLQYYKISNNFGTIRDRFKSKYPHSQNLFTSESLRSKLYKLIRVSIRKLMYQIQHYHKSKTPILCRLDDNRVKAIIYYHQGRQIKLQLLELYASKNYDSRLLVRTILGVNQYISKMEQSYHSEDAQSTSGIAKRKKSYKEHSRVGIRKKGLKKQIKNVEDGESKKHNYHQQHENEEIINGDQLFFDEDSVWKQRPTPNRKIKDINEVDNWLDEEFK